MCVCKMKDKKQNKNCEIVTMKGGVGCKNLECIMPLLYAATSLFVFILPREHVRAFTPE